MDLFVVLLFLLYASQDCLAVKLEVQEGTASVLLPCQYNQVLEEIVTVKWSRFDLNPNTVHQRQEGDKLQEQNLMYRGRTSMRFDALDSGDFSLTLRELRLLDSGIYICSMSENQEETALSGVHLHVKASQDSLSVTLDVYQGEASVELPCQNSRGFKEIVAVKWSRFDLNPNSVHLRREADDLQAQNVFFSGRTSMRSDALDSGNFKLTLREAQLEDSGIYICSISQKTEEIMLSGIQLNVRDKFPTWSRVFLVLLILLPVSGSLLFHFRHYFMSVYRVEVDSGVESVLLPFKTTVRLPAEVKVIWKHNNGRMVYSNKRHFNELRQRQYKERSDMKKSGKFGDFSLTLKKPTSGDTGSYTCSIYNELEKLLTKKQVQLNVKAGADSLIIAIDFGSGYSGYAFNVKPREEGGEAQLKRWGGELGLDSPKTPTCILFDEHKEFMKFGYEAKTAYSNMRKEEAEKHYFCEYFKFFVLNMDYGEETFYLGNGERMSILKVFTEVLRFLKDDALKTINAQTAGGKFTASDFTWVLTVPDRLKDSAKKNMIEAATQADLVTAETKSKLMFVWESEAALTWCLKLRSDGFFTQSLSRDSQDQSPGAADPSCNDQPGSQEEVQFEVKSEETKVLLEKRRDEKRYLVVGGGDVYTKFTVIEVLEGGTLKKLHEVDIDEGGRYVDRKFKQFMKQIFSEFWVKYEQNFRNEVQKIMFDFTRVKHLDEDVQIICPDNLREQAQKKKEIKSFFDSEQGASWDDGNIKISREKLRSFFKESLQIITKKLKEILETNLNIGFIVLVGGLAERQILRQDITAQFGHQCKVLCPPGPQEVILKGAVELVRNPELVESQKKAPSCFKCFH